MHLTTHFVTTCGRDSDGAVGTVVRVLLSMVGRVVGMLGLAWGPGFFQVAWGGERIVLGLAWCEASGIYIGGLGYFG